MNLRQLEVFQAVMYGGTTKNAARLLGITQRVVSNLVRQLEDRLGLSLFDRIGGRLHPTLEAKVLSKTWSACSPVSPPCGTWSTTCAMPKGRFAGAPQNRAPPATFVMAT